MGRDALVEAITTVADDAGREALVARLTTLERPFVLSFVNAHAHNLAAQDPRFRADLLASDCILRDGIGMQLLYQLLGRAPGLNMHGTDFIPLLLRRFAGRPVALLGTQQPWLGTTATRVAQASPLGAVLDGFQPEAAYLPALLEKPADLVVLGMGMPRQERVAQLLKGGVKGPCLIVNGGAILDFLGGKVQRAPKWMSAVGLEWTYRLAQEPRRLFKRYVVGNATFLARAVRTRLGG
jgi:N-acetylglucosaminyldiphosphoundecaprenol N-acetyl-beta-D-mannosaminyltransferase